MRWEMATNQQIKTIVESDGGCPAHLLSQALEEAVYRDLYKPFVASLLNKKYKTIRFAENVTKLTFDELKNLCYEQAFEAIKHFKPGKNAFVSFWMNFIFTALVRETRKYSAEKRTADMVYIDSEENHIQIIDDYNTERKVINQITIESLLEQMNEKERFIVKKLYEGYSYIEISKMFGYGRNYANNIHYKMIKRLKGA